MTPIGPKPTRPGALVIVSTTEYPKNVQWSFCTLFFYMDTYPGQETDMAQTEAP